jgi:uncharacterized Zn-binding protein involved in type VI secretion
MTQYAFGQSIPVTGLNAGFPGAVSRFGDRVVKARVFAPLTATNNLNFGDPAVLIPTTTGGTWTSVADYIGTAANIAKIAAQFAGMAVREVKTSLTYPAGVTPGNNQTGYYSNGQEAEVLERGSGTVALTVGAPSAGDQVYTRVLASATSSALGDWETNPNGTDLITSVIPSGVAGSTTITINGTLALYVGMPVVCAGIVPAGATIATISGGTAGAATAITISSALLNTLVAGVTITFSNLVALPNVVVTTGDVDANGMVEITIKNRNIA